MINGELIVDNFAGGGGASTGIEIATGASVDIAINHDSFMVIMCLEGECQIITDHGTITPMRRGETILVAAATASVEANGSATLLTAQA